MARTRSAISAIATSHSIMSTPPSATQRRGEPVLVVRIVGYARGLVAKVTLRFRIGPITADLFDPRIIDEDLDAAIDVAKIASRLVPGTCHVDFSLSQFFCRITTVWSVPSIREISASTNGISISPFFPEWAKLGQERPCRAVLVMEMPQLVGDRRRPDEEVIGRIAHAFAHPRHVDHGVDQDVADVDAARSEIARDRFG